MNRRTIPTRTAFTLIEMSVVLLIIALVTHLALRQLAASTEHKRVSAANRQLEDIATRVFSYDRDGVPTGFLADMGRLPAVTNGTLAELWQRPSEAKPYAVRKAIAENFVPLPETDLRRLTNEQICVATGWRGPYLRLPLGKKRLTDPWGNPMENPDTAGYARLDVTNGCVIAVSHFGPTALSRDPQRQRLSILPTGSAANGTSRVVVRLVSQSGEELGDVEYAWYGPRDGLIVGGVTNRPYGATAEFTNLTPGLRILRAKWGTNKSVTRQLHVKPGDNLFELKAP